ncbi:MAG: protein kinase [Deltaproteobacteria bacterium]|nr:protein kinase [Deltaproteobacteria bacterium]
MIGQLIDGKFEIIRLIGQGGMGAVYEARVRDEKAPDGADDKDERRVAIKLINDEELAQDDVLLARFEREATAAAKVVSPHIVEMIGSGHDEESGLPFMVMELLEGENAQQLVQRLGPIPPDLAFRIGVQTCLGLAVAHGGGVVHRDIKPANLFVAEGEGGELTVKLLDFGVAKFKMDQALETGGESLTRTGSMLGSPLYMSPEQARGLKTIDHRADIWSLGIVLFQLLTGRQPHEGIDGLGELIITICSEPPPAATKFAPWVSAKMVEMVQGALKLSSSDRYQTAEEMGEALRTCLPDSSDWRIDQDMLIALTDEQKAARPTEDKSGAGLENLDATIALSDPAGAAFLDALPDSEPAGPAPEPSDDNAATLALDVSPAAHLPDPDDAPAEGEPDTAATLALDVSPVADLPEPDAKPAPSPVKRPARRKPAPNQALETALAAARLDDSRKNATQRSGSRMMIALIAGLILGAAALALYILLRSATPAAPPTPTAPSTSTTAAPALP